MSAQEFSRLDVLRDLDSGRITAVEAGQLLGLGRSQVFNLLGQLRRHGAASLVSKRRGRASNNRLPGTVRDLAMALVKERYADFRPPFPAALPALSADGVLASAARPTDRYGAGD